MMFDAVDQLYHKSCHSVAAKNGMVCSSNPLASSAGLEILKKGGNAVDAAIASAAVLSVVEPVSNGLGGDAFAIVWMKDTMYGLNASGYSPASMSIERLRERGYTRMPKRGWIPVTIPGQPKAWAALARRFGKLSLKETLKPAITYAEEGFPVSPVTAYLWKKYTEKNLLDFGSDPVYKEWFRVFTNHKQAYQFGDIVRFPDHAKTLRLIAESDAEAFYQGCIMEKIVEQSHRDGGFIEKEDMQAYEVEWVNPIAMKYRGYDVWEIPPNGQGIVTLIALNILKHFKFEKKDCTDTYHKQFEAMKIAFADALAVVTDAKDMKQDYHKFLSDAYGEKRALELRDEAIVPPDVRPPGSGTVYLCAADEEGNMISFIQSNYMDFGSGIVIEGYGIALQNRGYDFSLDAQDVNALAPRKRCYHTIIPGFLTKDGKAVGPFGVMGGYMQPQGHLQVMMNLIDFHLNPQMCLDAPRWQWKEGMKFMVEPDFNQEIVRELRERGHDITYADNDTSFGRAQMIVCLDNGVYVGASEARADGCVSCY